MRLTTWVNAPVDRCFRLATSTEFNASGGSTSEVHCISPDVLQVGDTVSWHAWRWGLRLSHTSRIDEIRPCTYFREVMVDGGFRRYEHEHHFAPMDDGTRMRDEVRFASSIGPLDPLLERMLLKRYVMRLLTERHRRIKRAAETGEWRKYLHGEQEPTPVPEPRPKVAKMQKFA